MSNNNNISDTTSDNTEAVTRVEALKAVTREPLEEYHASEDFRKATAELAPKLAGQPRRTLQDHSREFRADLERIRPGQPEEEYDAMVAVYEDSMRDLWRRKGVEGLPEEGVKGEKKD